MTEMLLEWIAILCFAGLTITRGLDFDWNGCGLNFSLFLLYIFLYIKPIK